MIYVIVGSRLVPQVPDVVELPPKPKPSAEVDSGDVPTVVVGGSASPPPFREGGGGG